MIRQQISLTNRLIHHSTTLTNERGKVELEPNTADLRVDHRLSSRGLSVHKNIPVSITKLTLGLRVGFISSHLIADKLFPINPRAISGPPKMSLLLEAKSMPALIIKPRFILVTHKDDLGSYITSNQQGKMFVQNLNRIYPILRICSYCSIPSSLYVPTPRSVYPAPYKLLLFPVPCFLYDPNPRSLYPTPNMFLLPVPYTQPYMFLPPFSIRCSLCVSTPYSLYPAPYIFLLLVP